MTELAVARDAVRERERRMALVAAAERVRADAEREASSARAARDTLADEVDELSSVSAARVWASLRGTRDEQLGDLTAREGGADAAVVAAEEAVAAATEQVRRAFASVRTLGEPAERLVAALQAREAWLVDSGTPEGAELGLVIGRLEAARTARANAADLRDEAGRARGLLTSAMEQLDEAHDRARKDVWSDSSRHDRRKYEHMESADALVSQANHAIDRLRRRLEDDALAGAATTIQTSGSSRTWDTWFDNYWSDRRVRDEIDDSAARVASTRGRIDELVAALGERVREVDDEIQGLQARREVLVG